MIYIGLLFSASIGGLLGNLTSYFEERKCPGCNENNGTEKSHKVMAIIFLVLSIISGITLLIGLL